MPADTYLTFQKFNDPALAEAIAEQLHAKGINSIVEKEDAMLDSTFIGNGLNSTIHLKITSSDFEKANDVLDKFYQQQIGTMDPDYYLFSFTDEELLEIMRKPDEWGQLDYALARHLLAERGRELSSHQLEQFQQQRITDLAKPETTHPVHILMGYLAAVFGGFFGFIFGYVLLTLMKTLPNGQRVYVYPLPERRHGKRILIISAISFMIWLWLFLHERLALWMKPM
jgi:hypothetical protein